MVALRNPFRRQDSVDATQIAAPTLTANQSYNDDVKSPSDEKKDAFDAAPTGDEGEVVNVNGHEVHAHNPWESAGAENMLANGKERPIEVGNTIFCAI